VAPQQGCVDICAYVNPSTHLRQLRYIAEARAKADTAETLKNALQQQIHDLLADKKELSEQLRNLREKKNGKRMLLGM